MKQLFTFKKKTTLKRVLYEGKLGMGQAERSPRINLINRVAVLLSKFNSIIIVIIIVITTPVDYFSIGQATMHEPCVD